MNTIQSTVENTLENTLQGKQKIPSSLENIQSAEELKEATEGFEAIFLQKLLGVMREGLGKNDMLSSNEENIWRSMLDEEYAKSFSKVGGIGLANMLYQQLAPEVLGTEKVQQRTGIEANANYKKDKYPISDTKENKSTVLEGKII